MADPTANMTSAAMAPPVDAEQVAAARPTPTTTTTATPSTPKVKPQIEMVRPSSTSQPNITETTNASAEPHPAASDAEAGHIIIGETRYEAEQAAAIQQYIENEKSKWLSGMKKQVGLQFDDALFRVESYIGAAIRHILLVPVRRQPEFIQFGGQSFDPNPPDWKDPEEVAESLREVGKDICTKLSSLGELITDKKHPFYNIPAHLIEYSLQWNNFGPSNFHDKLRRLYEEEDTENRHAHLPADRKKQWHVFSDLPDRKPVHGHAEPEEDTISTSKAKGKRPVDQNLISTKASTKAKKDQNPKQTWRENPKNGVVIYLEATEDDIVRTHRSFWGQQHWESEGWIIPPDAIFIAEMEEGTLKEYYKQNAAKYCTTCHGTGWLVIAYHDVGNCNECQHGNKFVTIDIYIPPGRRYYTLRRGWSINDNGDVLDTAMKLAAPKNNVGKLHVYGKQVWESGTTYTRANIGTPRHISEAYRKGTLRTLKLNSFDRWLLKDDKNKVKYKMAFEVHSRAFELPKKKNKILNEWDGQKPKTLAEFHAVRMHEVWDFAGFADNEVEFLLAKMLKAVERLGKDGNILESAFDTHKDWFTREDVEEFRSCTSLERLVLHLGGTVPGSRRKESAAKRAKKSKEDTPVDLGLSLEGTVTPRKRGASASPGGKNTRVKLEPQPDMYAIIHESKYSDSE
ncbi:hypothetical protein HBI57_173180 [Parastagonospora nodorum]|nr:hypothetical protein HBI57_173180 [Parastagonospora nodorum]KAH6476130.1 hypothetical protein HBI58_115640 [Parastagonospora nodorum]